MSKMEKTYWSLFIFLVIAIIGLVGCFTVFCVTCAKKKFNFRNCIIMGVIIGGACIFCVKSLIPLLQDFDMVLRHEYIEDIGTVIEFTESYRDLDGNGRMTYSKPRFYIPEKDMYIILYLKEVQVGKKYKIKYYPYSKIAEAILIE